jgi:hypothetical protein
MLSKNDTQSLETIVFRNGSPYEIKVKSQSTNCTYVYQVPFELKDLHEFCGRNDKNFFALYNKAKMLLDERLVATEGYKIFDEIFDGLTHSQAYRLAKYILNKDLVTPAVKTIETKVSVDYATYLNAIGQLHGAYELKLENEVKAGRLDQEQAGRLLKIVTELKDTYLNNKVVSHFGK